MKPGPARLTRAAIVAASSVAVVLSTLTGCSNDVETGPPARDSLELPVAFALKRDQAGLTGTALTLSDPSEANYRQWLSAEQIADNYGASAEDAAATLQQLEAAGFVGSIHPTRGVIVGSMSASEAENLLGVPIITVKTEDLLVARPAKTPRVPRSLRDTVTAVVGLTLLHPEQPTTSSPAPTTNQVDCPPAPGVTAQIAEYYGLIPVVAAGRGGEGVIMGMFQTDQISNRALDVFSKCYDTRIAPVSTVAVDESDPVAFGPSAEESTLDIIAASLVAPNLERIIAYQFNPRTSLIFPLAAAVGDALGPEGPNIITTSIGVCENAPRVEALEIGEWLLASAAAAGVTVVAASGDTGSSSCLPDDTSEASQYPASSPFVTGVGGTQPTRSNGRIIAQQVWNTSPQTLNAGGGATVSRFPRPAYQQDIDIAGARLVPDLAFVAAPATFGPIPVCDDSGICKLAVVGGTSATAPGFAAAISEVMDALDPADPEPTQLGLLNPAIYQLAAAPEGQRIFMDVTEGNNDLYDVGCCTAGPGYDAASGWGSVNFAELLAELQR